MPVKSISYPAVFMRGGSASGLFFHLEDLPEAGVERDFVLVKAMGSPDPYGMQIDGLGSGTTSTSKCAIISKSSRPGCDVDYLFAQVSVTRAEVDWNRSCGNLAAAAALFAVEEGLVTENDEGHYKVVLAQVNRNEVIRANVNIETNRVDLEFENSKKGAPAFLGPRPTFEVDLPNFRAVEVSVIDATNIFAFVKSDSIKSESENENDFSAIKERVDALQNAIADRIFGGEPKKRARVLLVDSPKNFEDAGGALVAASSMDLFLRALSNHGFHHAIPMTAVMAASVGALVPGSILNSLLKVPLVNDQVRIGHPSGVAVARPLVSINGGSAKFVNAQIELSARRIMSGEVHISVN